ncbi:uncharacterized protein HMPREF1541_07033 [Cyphellophora europaea CBS 101466]|uniref:Uncharacterized protein n=1 Tax=Cyphellophora europaea (strain CBS 101466) TaxID=1220924 RepID=W2RR57_CYPE1|nr:uncharacterized protein HMPREF1541_07033 [Cyphellophora europaea CBS 101466]ETN38991.1 hypothetical protein HMPREF1541_07033 [Cyphellophora europaea CBS 101466]
MAPTKPEPALLHDQTPPRLSFENNNEALDTTGHTRPKSEFNPCANAKISSPFYLYNHDSPRPSENKPRPSINITVQDLEQGLTPMSTNATPAVIREKQGSVDSGKLRNGSWRLNLGKKQSHCMTKPKVSRWKAMSQKQRLAIKLAFAVLLIGLIIGLAVGLTKALGGGVWKSNNSTSEIN